VLVLGVTKGISKTLAGITARRKKPIIALLVDGPNMLRKDLSVDVDLLKIKKMLSEIGKIKVALVFLNKFASDKLIDAVSNSGFKPVVCPGKIEVSLALEAAILMTSKRITHIALASRDAGFLPLIHKAKEMGKEVIVIGAEPGFSIALQNAADKVFKLS